MIDQNLLAAAQEKMPEGYVKLTVTFHTGDPHWEAMGYKPSFRGWGSTPDEALQRLIDNQYCKEIRYKMEQFWNDNYSREKFEALDKFMEEYDAHLSPGT